jgi:excisionase family DNA binding protein
MRLVTYQQLAEALQVSRTTIERMVRKGRLPKPIKLAPGQSSSARFDMDAVEAALAKLQTGSKA